MSENLSTRDPSRKSASPAGDTIKGEIEKAEIAAIGKDIDIDAKRIYNTFVNPGGAFSLSSMVEMLSSTQARDPTNHTQEIEEYLASVEMLIKRELSKAGDEHFVQLSMKMAQSSDYSVPGGDLYRMVPGQSTEEKHVIHNLGGLQRVLDKRSLILLGLPGSGKSTVLHHLALQMIGAYRDEKSNRLPLFVRLTEYQLVEDRAQPILEFLRSRAAALVGDNHFITREFENLTRANRFVFILDGLDQMPDRRSETIRLKKLKRIEDELKRYDWMLKIARLFRQKNAVSRLLGSRQNITTEAAPKVDPREEAIDQLPELFPLQCAVITSCRYHDYIGVPRWQTLSILSMDSDQINEFVRLYSPGFEDLLSQLKASDSTRALITNPFYLRMLTQALKLDSHDPEHVSDLRKAVNKRGKLLQQLISRSIYRFVSRKKQGLEPRSIQERVEHILGKLGQLAYYMLERNIIGSVPNEALERILGNDLRLVIDAATEGNLITIHEGDIGGIEFNHQLFLEFLLAFDLKQKAVKEGGFEEALLLLSHRGDRWAETVRLLFEMVDEGSAEMLVTKFVDAVRAPETWDLATRVLSDLGLQVAPYVAPLLNESDSNTVMGAAVILGKIDAQIYAGRLAELVLAKDWRVRRSAVRALAAMKLHPQVSKFESDPHPSVVRAVFKAFLELEERPAEIIATELTGKNSFRSEQMAYAALDTFSGLLARLPEQEMTALLKTLVNHRNQDVRVIGFLMLQQSPDYFRRRLKTELNHAALEDDDTFVNVIARRALAPLLNRSEMAAIRKLAPKTPNVFDQTPKNKRALRAYWLLLEAQETVSPSDYLNSLFCAPQPEVQLLTKKLSRRADSISLSFLTFLLADERTAPAAVEALVGLKEKGVAYLLDALRDPSVKIRANVAGLLKFCHLPAQHARLVRKNLRAEKIRTHDVRPITYEIPQSPAPGKIQQYATAAYTLLVVFLVELIVWWASKLVGSATSYSYWVRFGLWTGAEVPTVDERTKWWVAEIERRAFGQLLAVRDADFWLSRGRLERALGDQFPAKESFTTSLKLNPDSTATRLELALVQRSLGKITLARETLEASNGKYLVKDSDLEALRRLLLHEEAAAENLQNVDEAERMHLLNQLGLWPEAQTSALKVLRDQPNATAPYRILFHSYRGMKQTRRALAAALQYNNETQEPKIREVDLEDLRWQHRSDSYPAPDLGRFEIALDLEQDGMALEELRTLGILPGSGMEMSETNLDKARRLPLEIKREVRGLLSRSGLKEISDAITNLMPARDDLD